MKKILSMLLITIIIATMCVGCQSKGNKSITLKDGEQKVSIKLDSSSDYSLNKVNDSIYEIYKGKTKCATSTFITEEKFDEYASTTFGTEGCRVIGAGESEGTVYMFFEYKDNENVQYNRTLYIPDNIHMFLECFTDEEEAKEIFYALKFTLK